jgi:hypothetical protein
MAELDYAFLADYASVQGDKLTTVGGSFTYVQTPALPTAMRLFVAGRIRAKEHETDIKLTLRVTAPSPGIEIRFEGTASPGPSQRPYDGKVGLLFAFEIPLMLQSPGLYEIFVSVDGKDRRLAFSVEGS